MSINKTSVDDTEALNNKICSEEWDNAIPVNLCKIYNWFGGLTNLFRLTGEVVSEIEGYPPPSTYGYGYQVKITKEIIFL